MSERRDGSIRTGIDALISAARTQLDWLLTELKSDEPKCD